MKMWTYLRNKLLRERVLQIWWWYLYWFRRYREKTRGLEPPPHPTPFSGMPVTRTEWKANIQLRIMKIFTIRLGRVVMDSWTQILRSVSAFHEWLRQCIFAFVAVDCQLARIRWCLTSGGGLRGAGHLRKCPPGPQSKIMVVKKGKMTFLTKRGKMTPLTPGTLDWGHLHRLPPPPRNPPQLCLTFSRLMKMSLLWPMLIFSYDTHLTVSRSCQQHGLYWYHTVENWAVNFWLSAHLVVSYAWWHTLWSGIQDLHQHHHQSPFLNWKSVTIYPVTGLIRVILRLMSSPQNLTSGGRGGDANTYFLWPHQYTLLWPISKFYILPYVEISFQH